MKEASGRSSGPLRPITRPWWASIRPSVVQRFTWRQENHKTPPTHRMAGKCKNLPHR